MTIDYQTRLMDMTSIANVTYIGFAEVGTSSASPAWTIQRIQFDIDGNPIDSRWTLKVSAIWDNRISETYL